MKIGIVGCGYVCEQHLHALRRLRNVNVVGVCDRHLERATAVAKANGLPHAFDDFSKMIKKTRPEVVHVLTPPQSHFDLTRKALEARCHVLVEKPLAVNAQEAREMLDLSRQKELNLGVCHNFRFVPSFLKARELIDRGALGRILSAEVFWKMSSYGSNQRCHAREWVRNLQGGIFQEVMPHLVYLLAAVVGDLKLASVITGGMDEHDGQSELRALFDSATGPATLGVSLSTRPVQKFVRIYGTAMSLHVDLATSLLLRQRSHKDGIIGRAFLNLDQSAQLAAGTVTNAIRTIFHALPRGHETLIKNFYDALRSGESPPADGEEGLVTVAVLDEVWHALGREANRDA
jgi:predicted dehydrogenase